MTTGKNETQSDAAIALKMREFEITQLAQRNNFFMIFKVLCWLGSFNPLMQYLSLAF